VKSRARTGFETGAQEIESVESEDVNSSIGVADVAEHLISNLWSKSGSP
jgi:hypothetical protein